jgi:regulatory protein
VDVDGRSAATVSAQVLAELGVRIGSRVDEGVANSLREESSRLAVFDKAVELLAVRARSECDLRLRLRRAGAMADAIDRALERLRALGLVDDDAYARQLAHARVVGGGVSKRRIGQELQRRGVSRDVADEAIGATLEDVELDEFEAAKGVAEKRLRSMRSLDPETRRRRIYGFLARRGYDHDVISRALKALGGGATGGDDADREEDDDRE